MCIFHSTHRASRHLIAWSSRLELPAPPHPTSPMEQMNYFWVDVQRSAVARCLTKGNFLIFLASSYYGPYISLCIPKPKCTMTSLRVSCEWNYKGRKLVSLCLKIILLPYITIRDTAIFLDLASCVQHDVSKWSCISVSGLFAAVECMPLYEISFRKPQFMCHPQDGGPGGC